jgi:hypothetical protein
MNSSLGLPAEYATDHGIIAAAEATGQALQSIRVSACKREHRVCCFQMHRSLETQQVGIVIPANAGMTGWTALLQATSRRPEADSHTLD